MVEQIWTNDEWLKIKERVADEIKRGDLFLRDGSKYSFVFNGKKATVARINVGYGLVSSINAGVPSYRIILSQGELDKLGLG